MSVLCQFCVSFVSVLCQFCVSFVSVWSFRDMIWLVFLWNGTALLIFSGGSAPVGLGFCWFRPCLWAVFMLSAGRKPLCRRREHITSFSPFVQKRGFVSTGALGGKRGRTRETEAARPGRAVSRARQRQGGREGQGHPQRQGGRGTGQGQGGRRGRHI